MSKSNGNGAVLSDFYKTNGGDYRVFNTEPSRTRQEFAEECDINTLMARYERTGVLPANPVGEPFYADFTAVPGDLMETLRLFDDAQKAFMTLPAVVRKEFENNPHYFTEFAADPANLDQMREWGLAPPAPVEVLQPVSSAPSAAAPAPGSSAAPSSAAPSAPTHGST